MSLRRLSKKDLKELLRAIQEVTKDWRILGVFLDLPESELKKIESDHKQDVNSCKMEMLILWLNTDVNATWEFLASALEAGLNMKVPAEDIRRKFVKCAESRGDELPRLILKPRNPGDEATIVVEPRHWTEVVPTPPQKESGTNKHFFDQWRTQFPAHVTGPNSTELLSSQTVCDSTAATTGQSDPSADHPLPDSPSSAGSSTSTEISTGLLPSLISYSCSNPATRQLTGANGHDSVSLPPSEEKQQTKRKRSLKNDVNASEDQRIVHLKEQFAFLLNKVLEILRDEELAIVYQVQVLVQQLPISCSDPQRVLEPQERLQIQNAKCIPQIFSILSGKYISYENFSLLESIARTFCNRIAKPLLDAYTKEYHNPDSTDHPQLQQIFTEEGLKLAKTRDEFAYLVVKIMCILEKRRLNLQKLSVYIRKAKKLRHEDADKLKNPESVSHIFSIIVSYIEYDNYYLLQCVVERFGNAEARELMENYQQRGTSHNGHSSDEDDESPRSDGRSNGLTNHSLASCSSRSRSQFSSNVKHSKKGGAQDCSEDQEQQQHCSQEAASSQETTSAVDTLNAATIPESSTDDTHSAVAVSTISHPFTNDTHSATSISTGPPADRSLSSTLGLSQRVCYSDKLSKSSYLLAVTNGDDSSTATSSCLPPTTTNSSPQIQIVVVVQPTVGAKSEPFVGESKEEKIPISNSLAVTSTQPPAHQPHNATHDHTTTQSERKNNSSSNGHCHYSQTSESKHSTKEHSSHTFKHNKTQSQISRPAATTTNTSDLSMVRRRVKSTALPSASVLSCNNPLQPLSPVALSSSNSSKSSPSQDSPQSGVTVVKSPKQSRARKALSHIKRIFKRNHETSHEYDRASINDSSITQSLVLSLTDNLNSMPIPV